MSRKSGIVGVLKLKDPVMRDLGFCCEPAYLEKTTIQTVDESNTGVRRKTDPTGKSNGDKEKVEDNGPERNPALRQPKRRMDRISGH